MDKNLISLLHRLLNERFNDQELRTLCDLYIHDAKYDDLQGDGTGNKARELINFCKRRNRLEDLIQAIEHFRPDTKFELSKFKDSLKGEVPTHSPKREVPIHSPKRESVPNSPTYKLKVAELFFSPIILGILIGIIIALAGVGLWKAFQSSSTTLTSENNKIWPINSIPRTIVSYIGGDSQTPDSETMIIYYDQNGEPSYSLYYNFPPYQNGEKIWAGIAMQFEPLDISEYQYIELKIKFSSPQTTCHLKLIDSLGDESHFLLENAASKAGVTTRAEEGSQIITIPLRGNFDRVNLEQIKEISLVATSDLGDGEHSFTVSHVLFRKQ